MRLILATGSQRAPWSNEYMIQKRSTWTPHSHSPVVYVGFRAPYDLLSNVLWSVQLVAFCDGEVSRARFFYFVYTEFQHTHVRKVDWRVMLSTALRNSSKDSVYGVPGGQGQFSWVSAMLSLFFFWKFLEIVLLFLLSRRCHRHQMFSPFLFASPTLIHFLLESISSLS